MAAAFSPDIGIIPENSALTSVLTGTRAFVLYFSEIREDAKAAGKTGWRPDLAPVFRRGLSGCVPRNFFRVFAFRVLNRQLPNVTFGSARRYIVEVQVKHNSCPKQIA